MYARIYKRINIYSRIGLGAAQSSSSSSSYGSLIEVVFLSHLFSRYAHNCYIVYLCVYLCLFEYMLRASVCDARIPICVNTFFWLSIICFFIHVEVHRSFNGLAGYRGSHSYRWDSMLSWRRRDGLVFGLCVLARC